MNAPVPVKVAIPSLAMDEQELIAVLASSIYPGAKPESIKLAIGYCRSAGLDPLQKPVHIVPMDVKSGKKDNNGKDIYEKRDVVMPGVGLYRVQAARSGEYAGMTEPEFGPDKTVKLGKDDSRVDYTFPEWCKVTVRRVVGGREVAFTAVEYWLENYATAGRWTTEPNAMWKKRPRGQLAKCTEAQALRKAFPELGAQPTADEMEGRVIEVEPAPAAATQIAAPRAVGDAAPAAAVETATTVEGDGDKKESPLLTDGAKSTLRKALERAGRTEDQLVADGGFPKLDDMRFEQFNEAMSWAKKPAEGAQ